MTTTHVRLLTSGFIGFLLVAAARQSNVAVVQAQSDDPCAGVTPAGASSSSTGSQPSKSSLPGHDDRWRHLDTLWAHRSAVAHNRVAPRSSDRSRAQDDGEIAVVQDVGDIVMKANPLDLGDVGLRLTANGAGG